MPSTNTAVVSEPRRKHSGSSGSTGGGVGGGDGTVDSIMSGHFPLPLPCHPLPCHPLP